MTLKIPPFLSDKAQFNEEEAENTQSVASVRIHVERAISRIKMYKIITNVVPLCLAGMLNQIWTVCCMLLLFQSPIIDQEKFKGDWSFWSIKCLPFIVKKLNFKISNPLLYFEQIHACKLDKFILCMLFVISYLLIASKGKASSKKNKVHEL